MTKPYVTQKELVKENLLKALDYHNGNRTHTAKGLGIGIRTLQRHLKKAGLENYKNNYAKKDSNETDSNS